jgi:NAD(P)-dependent dehydrogenase (short-subunit alcohol dehydrogenase family)
MSRCVCSILHYGNEMQLFDLNGRVVLLTGAAGYLGRAMSRAILEAGADLVITGRRESALLALKNELSQELRDRCHILAGDVTHPDTPEQIRVHLVKHFGVLHGIVNNAYSGRPGDINSIGADDFLLAYSYNLLVPFTLIKTLIPLMERGATSRLATSAIVNVASMYGSVSPDPSVYGDSGENNPIHYGATKGGMIQMTRYLACHLAQRGIRVNSIAPGPFPDHESESAIPGFHEKLAMRVPMGRIGKPEEVSGPVVFLLSDAAAYVNGVNLPVDGGWTAW